jgi:protein-disulfide isomerase
MSKRRERIAERQQQQKMRTIWISFAVVILIVAAGAWWLTRPESAMDTEMMPIAELRPDSGEWSLGNPEADLVLIEYADFQCGACGYYHPIIKDLMDEYEDRVFYVFRHFPLTNIHQYATLASRSAEAAGRQGKFWEMADIIFANQNTWARGNAPFEFTKYAREIALDIDQFQKDLGSDELFRRVEEDYQSGLELNITSVPSFFVNGEKIMNPRTLDEFRNLIDRRLQAGERE